MRTLLHVCWVSHVVKLCCIIVTSLLWFLQIRYYCFHTCLLHLTRFFICFWEVATAPSRDGVTIYTRWSASSLAGISSRHPSVIPLVYIISVAWYCKNHSFAHYPRHEFWKFLRRQASLIDAIGKVWHCSVDRSMGTCVLLDSFVTTDTIWRKYHQLITHMPKCEANYIRQIRTCSLLSWQFV